MNVDNSTSMVDKIARLYAEKLMSDVTLVVGGEEFPCHRLILCASSDVFQVMLMNPAWSESQESRIVLEETDACCAVFKHFLRYLYTGKIVLDFSSVVPVVSLADKYNVKDLVRISLDFMSKNVSMACKRNQLVAWYQFASASGYIQLAQSCKDFIKWNFTLVSTKIDFVSLDVEMMADLLESDDIVVKDELELFHCLCVWLQRASAAAETVNPAGEGTCLARKLMLRLAPLVRFPMMRPKQLNDLFYSPLTKSHAKLLKDMISNAFLFHTGQVTQERMFQEKALYTPRLYTTESFCASVCIDHLSRLAPFNRCSLLFTGERYLAEFQGKEQTEWFVEVFPKGVCMYRPPITHQPQPPEAEIPDKGLSTVRISISTLGDQVLRVNIGVLVVGDQDEFEHFRLVKTKQHIFCDQSKILNFDNILDIDELNQTSFFRKGPCYFLTGPEKDCLKIYVVITPQIDKND